MKTTFTRLFFPLVTLAAAASVTWAADVPALGPDGFSLPMSDSGVPTYLIELKDGQLIPPQLVVPAKTRFRIVARNIGSKPAEFESNQLRLEKVLFMGAEAYMNVTPLDAGSYDYFDEFSPGVDGKLIAKPRS